MTRIGTLAAVAAAALFAMSGAMAASAEPAAGNEPVINQPAAPASTLTRSQVEAQAAKDLPAAGQSSEAREVVNGAPVTRAEVKTEAQKAAAKAGGFPDKSGNN